MDDGLDDEAEARDSQGSSSRSGKADEYNDEEWEIKCNIGLDCTLDYEVFVSLSLYENVFVYFYF